MFAWSFFPLLVSAAAASIGKRTVQTNVTVFAYGVGIRGYPIYADSNLLAVVSDNNTALANNLNNITWTIDTTGESPWNVTATNSSTLGHFYIVPSSDEDQAVGFNTTTATGAATTGFHLYGSTIEYATDSTYESKFYAQNSSSGVWSLMWNSNNETLEGVPVVLKTIPPPLPSDFDSA
ncbi:hypothetical protein GGR55DRAFT_628445 [Xylaria sp. FL0064]|nr:hypothetical protein GGR55DRAFT_628445 [Xylaria sp. FL0064]